MDSATLANLPDPFGLERYDDRLTWAELHLEDEDHSAQHLAAVIIINDGDFEDSDVTPARAASLLAAHGEAYTVIYAQRAHDAGVSWAEIGKRLWRAVPGGRKPGLSPQAVQQRCDRYAAILERRQSAS